MCLVLSTMNRHVETTEIHAVFSPKTHQRAEKLQSMFLHSWTYHCILFLGLWGQLMAVSLDMVGLWRLSPGLLLGALKFLHHAWRSRCRSQKLICTILANILAKNAQNRCCQYLHRRQDWNDWAVFNTGWCPLRLISPRLVTLVQLSFQSPDLSSM